MARLVIGDSLLAILRLPHSTDSGVLSVVNDAYQVVSDSLVTCDLHRGLEFVPDDFSFEIFGNSSA